MTIENNLWKYLGLFFPIMYFNCILWVAVIRAQFEINLKSCQVNYIIKLGYSFNDLLTCGVLSPQTEEYHH